MKLLSALLCLTLASCTVVSGTSGKRQLVTTADVKHLEFTGPGTHLVMDDVNHSGAWKSFSGILAALGFGAFVP